MSDRRGEGRDTALLGMPADDDWLLSANHNESLLRNATRYRTARSVFGRWAPRTRHAELVCSTATTGASTF